VRGFVECRDEQAWMKRDGDPVRRSFPLQSTVPRGKMKVVPGLCTDLERLTTRPHLVFDRAPQQDVDKMLYVLVLRDYASRHRIAFEHEP
jgi:hypothetical protein